MGEAVARRKQFSRREIVSNWKKYELEPLEDESKIVARGEKYETLLGMAGEAMSRFRFQDELEWEEEKSEDLPQDEFQTCTLNPTDLWESLSCIPLHQLLDIDENLFPRDQLKSIQQTASKNQVVYFSKHAKGLDSENILSKHSEGTRIISSNRKSSVAKSDVNISHDYDGDLNNVQIKSTPKLKDEDGHSDEQRLYQPNQMQSETSSFKDEYLDQVLEMDLDAVEEKSAVESSQDIKSGENDKESEELEEWLDSILD